MQARTLLLVLALLPTASSHASEETGASAALRGEEALKAGDSAAAIAAFTRATTLEPRTAQHWARLGVARAQDKDWDGAIAAYERALSIEPQAKTYNNLANVYFRRGTYDQAAEIYDQALALDPGYLLARFHHGWCLRQLQRGPEAEQAFRLCLQQQPHNDRERAIQADCLFGLGSMRHRAGDYESSARAMEQVLAVHPAHPEARYYLGIAYRQLGRPEDARRQLEIHAQTMKSHHQAPYIEKLPDE
jgi:tetratricopeptide (TPR) repeat protein